MQRDESDEIDITTSAIPRTAMPRRVRHIGARRRGLESVPGYPMASLFGPTRRQRKISDMTMEELAATIAVMSGPSGIPPDLRNWTWMHWVYVLGYIILFGVVIAGFILLVIQGNKCCGL